MSYITPQRIIDLKAKVKAECQRRRYTGRIDNTYGSATYDFTTVPTAGGLVLQEQHDKISIPLSAINSDNVPANTSPSHQLARESEIANMEAWVTSWSKISVQANTTSASGCKTSCTGLCASCTSCTSCSGCSGTCTGTCTGSCTGSCDGCTSCSNRCDGCTGCTDCSGGCDGCTGCTGCSFECANDCETICS